MANQCQWCQAGWETEKHKPWPKGSKTIIFNIVKGGYKGEKCVCTAYRYGTDIYEVKKEGEA